MFSGKSSRAGSASSAHREPLPESSDNDMPETYLASDFDSGLEGVSSKYRKYIESHPLRKMILQMAFDSTQLAKRVKMDSMQLNIEDLWREFYEKTQSDEQNLDKKLDLLAEKLEKALIDKDLNNHTINQAVKPPSNFSPVPTITTPTKRADAQKLFPTRHNNFSGATKDNGAGIVEFFSNLKFVQSLCMLSEAEFKDMLLCCTTGKAHTLLLDWIEQDHDLPSLYHNFIIQFDKRVTPKEARLQLSNFKASKSSSLAKLEWEELLVILNKFLQADNSIHGQKSFDVPCYLSPMLEVRPFHRTFL